MFISVPEYGQSINPISRLIQIQQAKKEKEPVFTLIAEKGTPRRREFVMEVGGLLALAYQWTTFIIEMWQSCLFLVQFLSLSVLEQVYGWVS